MKKLIKWYLNWLINTHDDFVLVAGHLAGLAVFFLSLIITIGTYGIVPILLIGTWWIARILQDNAAKILERMNENE